LLPRVTAISKGVPPVTPPFAFTSVPAAMCCFTASIFPFSTAS
jgi:hypothetical protein